MMMEKTALIIAYYYPPTNNGGVQRPAAFVKYLPRFGYKPVVITCQIPLALENDIGIYRIRDPGLELINAFPLKSIAFRGIRKMLYNLGILNGYLYWWYKEVLTYMPRIIEEQKPDIILATFPPQENLMVGMEISKRYNIPLVLDFRDGMVFEALQSEKFCVKLRLRHLEKNLVRTASRVISVTEPITSYFRCKYPESMVETISNGFDAEEWLEVKELMISKKINFVYTGRLSSSRSNISINSLIKAISELTREERKRFSINMVGEFSTKEIDMMKSCSCSEVFNIVGFVDRRRALQYQKSADFLLLVTGVGHKGVATGKLFEYLASNKPILGLTEGTAAEEIINRTGTGICISPNNITGIKTNLRSIIKSYPKVEFLFSPIKEEILRYDRRHLTQRLALIMDQVLEENTGSPN